MEEFQSFWNWNPSLLQFSKSVFNNLYIKFPILAFKNPLFWYYYQYKSLNCEWANSKSNTLSLFHLRRSRLFLRRLRRGKTPLLRHPHLRLRRRPLLSIQAEVTLLLRLYVRAWFFFNYCVVMCRFLMCCAQFLWYWICLRDSLK